MMMIEYSKLTKTFLENKNSFQCYHDIVGYCKYRENILVKFVRKKYAEISYANSDILNHVNMEINVISFK